MMDQNPTGYYRINISYEAWEITFGIDEWKRWYGSFTERSAGSQRALEFPRILSGTSFRVKSGVQIVPDGDMQIEPPRSLEFFGQLNYVETESFPSFGNWIFQAGLELRNRILFDFFSTEPEKRVWSIDTTLGWYNYPQNFRGRRLGFYLKLYGGQYPYGQFRETNGYLVLGSGLSLGL